MKRSKRSKCIILLNNPEILENAFSKLRHIGTRTKCANMNSKKQETETLKIADVVMANGTSVLYGNSMGNSVKTVDND